MERVDILIQRLQEQLQQQAAPQQLLLTAQMLVAELQSRQHNASVGKVAVTMPLAQMAIAALQEELLPNKNEVKEAIITEPEPIAIEPTVKEELLYVEEALPEPVAMESFIVEEEIIAKEEHKAFIPAPFFFETSINIPTLPQQETREYFSLNDKLIAETPTYNSLHKEQKTEVAETLEQSPIKDLKKAININDRYLFINELFRGDEAMYERSLKTIQGFTILPEATFWIQRELKLKLAWNDNNEAVQLFDQLVRRRFS